MLRRSRKYLAMSGHHPDYWFLGTVLFLLLVGLVFLSSASFDISKIRYNDTYYYLTHQITRGLLPGIGIFLLGYFLPYRKWKKAAPILLLLNLILLIGLFTPLGAVINGSHRWFTIGSFSFQPSEFLKFTFIVYVASLLSLRRGRRAGNELRTYLVFLAVSACVAFLIIIQPATTMAVLIIAAGAIVYFFKGMRWRYFILTCVVAVVSVGMLALVSPYRFSRVVPFWNDTVGATIPTFSLNDTKVDRYHLDQSLLSIGTGGLWGVGFGKSTSKYSVLPEPMSDSIFAVIAEEVGFIGALIIIIAFAFLFWRIMYLMKKSRDEFAQLLLLGFGSILAMQAFVHIAANTSLIPFTGIPLPFISYGGTALVVELGMVGVMANISRHVSLR